MRKVSSVKVSIGKVSKGGKVRKVSDGSKVPVSKVRK